MKKEIENNFDFDEITNILKHFKIKSTILSMYAMGNILYIIVNFYWLDRLFMVLKFHCLSTPSKFSSILLVSNIALENILVHENTITVNKYFSMCPISPKLILAYLFNPFSKPLLLHNPIC